MERNVDPTPSRPDDTPKLRYDSPDLAAARARIGELTTELFGEELEGQVRDFTARLPNDLVDDFWQLLLSFDSHIMTRELNRENVVWEAFTAHLPGLAPMLEVLRAHLQDDVEPDCVQPSVYRDPTGQPRVRDHCQIAREVGYASYPAVVSSPGNGARPATSPPPGNGADRMLKPRYPS
jgi:hypothetical protein